MVPLEHWSSRWDGGYRRVNRRLCALKSELEEAEYNHLFRAIPFRDGPIRGGHDDADRTSDDLVSWDWRGIIEDHRDLSDFGVLRKKHTGYEVTSYSRMKRAWNEELVPLGREELDREPARAPLAAVPAEGELPGGTAAGLLLHEILELVPFNSLAKVPTLTEWCGLPAVSDVVDAALAHNGIGATYRADAETMVYRALTFEVPLGSRGSIRGLCNCRHVLREMEFLFPYPERDHPALSEPRPGKLVIERGYIKGFVDLVIEHEGLVYFADWKSDVLASYQPDALKEHVAEHYDLQAKLYALALVKALQIGSKQEYEARFGGLVYVFLRGLRLAAPEEPAVFFDRPGWADILRYEAQIKTSRSSARPWGGRP
jgi:exodeoxyribonuclease V beta subunit